MVLRWALTTIGILLGSTTHAASSVLKPYDTTCSNQVKSAYSQLKKGLNPTIPTADKCPVENKLITWEWLMSADNKALFEDYRTFLEDNAHWPDQHLLQEKAEGLLTRAVPVKDILDFYEHRTPRTMSGLSAYTQALYATGKKEQANLWIRKFWHSQKLTARDEDFLYSAYKNLFNTNDHLRRLEHLVMRQDVYGLQRMSKRMPASYKTFIDVCVGYIKRKAKAQKQLTQLPQNLQKNTAIYYLQIHPYLKHKNAPEKKKLLLDKFAEAFRAGVTHEHPYDWWKIKMICARLAVEQGRAAEAYTWIKNADVPQDREKMAEIEWLAGWIALRHLKDYPTALKHFEQLQQSVSTPISKAKAAYWLARTYEALDESEKANEYYEQAALQAHTFYGQRSLEKLGRPISITLKKTATIADDRDPQDAELIEAIKIINSLDQRSKTEKFLLHLAKHTHPQMVEEIVELTHKLGLHHLVVLVAKFAGRQAPALIEVAYPIIPLPPLENKSPSLTVPLVYSLIRAESNFNTQAKSGPGARGLMQLMPTTAAIISKRLGIKFSSKRPQRLLKDHQFNIQLGIHNFNAELKSFDHSVILTLAGYNAGPGRPRQWILSFGDPRNPNIDWIDWIEQVPFAETRAYIQRILETVPIYKGRLQSKDASL